MVFAGSTVRVSKVFTLVAQRVHASLLVDVQPARVVHRNRGLRWHVRVRLIQGPVARLVYRPESGEVCEEFGHQRFVQYGTVNTV